LFPAGTTTTTLGSTVIAVMTVSAGGAGVMVVVGGGVRVVVVVGLGAVVGSRSNVGVIALATAMAPAAMVTGEATRGEA
jgi:hypothetical protein